MKKTEQFIAGHLLAPIHIGESAIILETEGVRNTSSVLSITEQTPTKMIFETRNTIYYLVFAPVMDILKRRKEVKTHE